MPRRVPQAIAGDAPVRHRMLPDRADGRPVQYPKPESRLAPAPV